MRRIFVFIGPPGSGKGSLSQLCMQHFGWVQLSTGALCRKHILEGTEIGQQIDFTIKSGKLIADDLMSSLVEEWLAEQGTKEQTIILDGFPRTVKQAELLVSVLQEKLPICQLSIVQLNVADEIVVQRLKNRAVCGNKDCQTVYSVLASSPLAPKKIMECDKCSCMLIRRSDDEVVSIRERLRSYREQAEELARYFIQVGIQVAELDVARGPEMIFKDFERLVGI